MRDKTDILKELESLKQKLHDVDYHFNKKTVGVKKHGSNFFGLFDALVAYLFYKDIAYFQINHYY